MSFFRRAGAAIGRVLVNATDPAAASGEVQLYAKLVSGTVQLFARASDGTITQLTPAASTVIPISYTATGSEGASFFVTLPSAQPNDTYQVWWAPKGITNVPLLDLPDSVPTDRTTTQFRVLIGGAPLTTGDKLVFFVLPQ